MASPGTAIDALESHLDAIQNGASPDADLLRIVKPSTEFLKEKDKKVLALKIWSLLPNLPPDEADTLIPILMDLVKRLPLSWILDMQIDLKQGLDLAAAPFHQIVLGILESADQDSVRRLATSYRELFEQLVKLWLLVPSIGTGEKAGNVLLHFFRVDKEGLVVKRIFRDVDIYESIYTICDENTRPQGVSRGRQSTAQTRLWFWLAELAKTNWNVLNESFHPEIEEKHGVPTGNGLLQFAATSLVRDISDSLLFSILIQFYGDIVTVTLEGGEPKPKPVGLEFLQSCGAHKIVMDLYSGVVSYEDLDDIHSDLSGYIINYSTFLPHVLVKNESDIKSIVQTLGSTLGAGRLGGNNAGKYIVNNLRILASLPRTILLNNFDLFQFLQRGHANPFVIKTLGDIFHGPVYKGSSGMSERLLDTAEVNLAGMLFERYLADCPNIFQIMAKNASNRAVAETALQSLHFIQQIITASWDSGRLLVCSNQYGPLFQDFFKMLLDVPNRTIATSVEADDVAVQIAEKKYHVASDLLRLMNRYVKEPGNLISAADHRALKDRLNVGVFGRLTGTEHAIATIAQR
jgi:hypothetical protein